MINKIIEFDKRVAFIFPKLYHHKFLNICMKFIASIGDFGMIWIALVLILSVYPQTKALSHKMLFALLLATIVGQVTIKSLVKRMRPCQQYPEVKILVPVPSDRSFPSGHTTSSFACATTVCFFYPEIGAICLLFAFAMAFSRIYLFVHYVSDVVFAMFLGILVGSIVMCI